MADPNSVGRPDMGGKLFLYHIPFWLTGGRWWHVEASIFELPNIIVEESRGGGYTIRSFEGEIMGRDITAGPFNSLAAAYAAWEVMRG